MSGLGMDGSRGFASMLWEVLNEGGVWAVPRSGLVFRKEGGVFILQDRMPWIEGMPFGPDEWNEWQQEEIEGVTTMFASIGITVQPLEI
jgi:hypothetical protein